MGVNKLYNAYQAGKQISQTVKSPIAQAVNKIKAVFKKPKKDLASKYRKEALKFTKENTAKAGKSAKEAESKIGKETAQNLGRETKSKMMKDFLRYNRNLKSKGGPVDKKKKKFPDLTSDGKVTFADVLKGRGVINGKKKNNKKVI